MARFIGSFDELKNLMESFGGMGTWTGITNGRQFRSHDGAIVNWFPNNGTLQFQGTREASEKLRQQLTEAISSSLPSASNQPETAGSVSSAKEETHKVFVVHGHDTTARDQLELILHKLDLDPFVLANTAGDGLTIIEALEREIGPKPERVRFGIVLMTPDDVGYAKKDGHEKTEPRARQNVVLEMGMLISALGRSNVTILRKGHLEPPSDATGILYISFNEHVREAVPKLVDRLRSAGFNLDPAKITHAST